jgi:hypothetical protein
MLARRAAAEVLAREQDRRAAITRLVQDEIRIRLARAGILTRFARIEIAPCIEQVRAEAGALDRLQELLRMMASVSTFSRSIGATSPLCTRNGSMSSTPLS